MTSQDLSTLGTDACAIAAHPLPAAVSDRLRALFVDTLGALLGGLRYPEVQALAARLGTGRFGRMVTLGTAATWLDADSGGAFHPHGDRLPPVPTAHPMPHVLPVVLNDAAGHDDTILLRAFVAGSELGLRLGAGSSLRPGLHPHGIHGPAGAAVTQALLDGGDARDATRAFVRGAALPLAATLAVPVGGGTVRNVWTGLGAYYGAVAGAAAVGDPDHPADVAALTELFDGAVCDELDLDVLVGPERHWRLCDSYLKPYACARWIHPAADALRTALGSRPASDIDGIEVDTFAFAASLRGSQPATDLAARFSLPFCLATLATDGQLAAPEFLPERLRRSEVIALAERVRVREDPDFSAALPGERPTTVVVRFVDGSTGRATVRNARGNPTDPLPVAEIEAKFRANAGDQLAATMVDELVGWLHVDPPSGDLLARVARAVLR